MAINILSELEKKRLCLNSVLAFQRQGAWVEMKMTDIVFIYVIDYWDIADVLV